MTDHKHIRYCADPSDLAAMKRDGLGWGHDLDCGCFYTASSPRPASGLRRLIRRFKKEV